MGDLRDLEIITLNLIKFSILQFAVQEIQIVHNIYLYVFRVIFYNGILKYKRFLEVVFY